MLRSGPARHLRLRHEAGFTLPELAVAIIVMLIVAAAIGGFIAVSVRQQSNQGERVSGTDDARNALLRMTSELRDAGAVTLVDARTVQAEAREADGSYALVTYSCEQAGTTSSCSRTDTTTSEEQLLVEGVVNDDNFAVATGSGVVDIELALDLEGTPSPVTLTAAVRPRNCSNIAGVVNPC